MSLKPVFLTAVFVFYMTSVFSQNEDYESNFGINNSDNKRFEKAVISDFTKKLLVSELSNDTIPSSVGVIVQDGYIEKMDNYVILRLSLINDNERFSIDAGPTTTNIYPNGSSNLKFNFNYRFLSFGINYIPKFVSSNDDDLIKGETTGMGLNFGLNFTNWVQSISYTRTTGYYLENTSDFDQNWQEGDPHIQFPNLHYRSIQGVTGYNFNRQFSTKALLTGTERQLKSAGTFFPTLLYRYYIVDNRDEINQTNSTQKSNNFEIIANAGYYYTYVLNEKFYVSGGASGGYGLISSKVFTRNIDETITSKQNNGVFKWDAQGALGYNGERFFSGFFLTAENRRFKQQNTSVINADWRVFMQVHIGYRLFAPKKLRDTVDSVPFLN